jgi:fibronectin type 3 domain-containing protein
MKKVFYFLITVFLFSCVIQLNEENIEKKSKSNDLNPPENITILPYSINSAIISWQDIENVSKYSVYKSLTELGNFEIEKTINDNIYIIQNLSLDTKYFFKVSASINNIGESVFSFPVSIIIVDLPKPIEVTATTASETSINISWSSIGEATGYKIYRALSTNGPYSLIGNTTETNYLDIGLETGTAYFYKIAGMKNGGEGPSSDTITAFTPLDIPNSLQVVVQSMSSIGLSWNAVHGATDYVLYKALTAEGAYSILATTTGLTYIDTELTQLIDYYYKVSAKNSNDEGLQSGYIRVAIEPPQPPENITFSVLSSTSIKLEWDNVIGANSYNIYRSTGGDFTLIGTVTTNVFTNTGLSRNVTYNYKITAINIAGEGTQSDNISARIENPSVPSNFTAQPYSINSIILSWDEVDGALMYEVFQIDSYGLYGRLGSTTELSYIVSRHTNGPSFQEGMPALYRFSIRSVNAIGSSNYASTRESYVMPISLTENIEYTSSVRGSANFVDSTSRYFSFPAGGGKYTITWTNPERIRVNCYWKSVNSIPVSSNSFFIGGSPPRSIETPVSGYVIIIVTGDWHGGGSFSIKYNRE